MSHHHVNNCKSFKSFPSRTSVMLSCSNRRITQQWKDNERTMSRYLYNTALSYGMLSPEIIHIALKCKLSCLPANVMECYNISCTCAVHNEKTKYKKEINKTVKIFSTNWTQVLFGKNTIQMSTIRALSAEHLNTVFYESDHQKHKTEDYHTWLQLWRIRLQKEIPVLNIVKSPPGTTIIYTHGLHCISILKRSVKRVGGAHALHYNMSSFLQELVFVWR